MADFGPAPMTFAGGKAPPPLGSNQTGALGEGLFLGRRIVIVEDEAMVAWSLATMAEDLGYDVVGTFSRGETALAGIGADGTDIVLMDINLGSAGLDGVETARQLRESHDFPIIFISAYADPATRARVEEQVPGAPLLRKPVSPALLADALADAQRRCN